MGSKSRIAKFIVPIIQSHIDSSHASEYIEPFVGGANVIDKIVCANKFGSDVNQELISLLEYAQAGNALPDTITRADYNDVREHQYAGKYPSWYVGCVGFLASYNGRYFDGGYAQPGYEHSKSGSRYRDYYKEARNNLIKQSESTLFKDILFSCRDYCEWVNVKNSVVYLDPPYSGVKQFQNSKSFSHTRFWEWAEEMSKNNIVLVSELAAPESWKCIWEKPVSRSIKSTDKTKAVEKLFVHN